MNDSILYYRRADINLTYAKNESQLFDGKFTIDMEAMVLHADGNEQLLPFNTIDSTVSFKRMLDSQPVTIPANAEYLDFLFSISVRDFNYDSTFSEEGITPVLDLNLYDIDIGEAIVSFKDLNFNKLVEFSKTEIDTSFLIRFNIQSFSGRQVYAVTNLLPGKNPVITEVYNFENNAGLFKNRGRIVYEVTQPAAVIPGEFYLSQNYPNPFNATTTIKYALPNRCDIKIEIFNIVGESVCTLIDEKQKAGFFEINWDAAAYSSGIYFVTINAGKFRDIKKMLLIK